MGRPRRLAGKRRFGPTDGPFCAPVGLELPDADPRLTAVNPADLAGCAETSFSGHESAGAPLVQGQDLLLLATADYTPPGFGRTFLSPTLPSFWLPADGHPRPTWANYRQGLFQRAGFDHKGHADADGHVPRERSIHFYDTNPNDAVCRPPARPQRRAPLQREGSVDGQCQRHLGC